MTATPRRRPLAFASLPPDPFTMTEPAKSYRFDATRRLHGSIQFQAVYDARLKKSVGPLAFFARANGLEFPRLGLSVPRRVGNAVKRTRVKRLLREAFRLSQNDWPRGYDVIIAVRPHDVATLAEYQRLLFSAIRSLHIEHERRDRKEIRDAKSEGEQQAPK